jgi:WD40 repeat protein
MLKQKLIFLIVTVLFVSLNSAAQIAAGQNEKVMESVSLNLEGRSAAVAFSPDGSLFAAGSSKNTIRVWDTASWSVISEFKQSDYVTNVLFTPGNSMLATVNNDLAKGGRRNAKILFWDVRSGKNISIYKEDPRSQGITAIAYSPDGKRLAVGFGEGLVQLLDVEHIADIKVLNNKVLSVDSGISFLRFSPNGRLLAVATGRGVSGPNDSMTLTVLNAITGRSIFINQEIRVHGLDFSPDGKFLAVGATRIGKVFVTTTLILFKTSNWKAGRELYDHPPEDLAFSSNGNTLVSLIADYDSSTIAVWDMKAQRIKRWIHQGGMIPSLAISPDGRLVAAGGDTGKIRIYKLPKQQIK